MKRLLCIGVAVTAAAAASWSAAGATFNTADGYWNVAGNWSPAVVPAYDSTVQIDGGRTARINSDLGLGGDAKYSLTITGGASLNFESGGMLKFGTTKGEGTFITFSSGTINIANGSTLWMHTTTAGGSGPAQINMTGGEVQMTGLNLGYGNVSTVNISGGTWGTGNTTGGWNVGNTAAATVTQSGSSTVAVGRGFNLGTVSGVKGTYNLQGGTFDGTGINNFFVGNSVAGAQGEMSITGGTLENGILGNGAIRIFIGGRLAGTSGKMTISSGKLHSPLLDIGSANGLGTGELVVSGSAGEIIVGRDWSDVNSVNPFFNLFANGKLTYQIDSSGISKINVTGTNGIYGDMTGIDTHAALAGTLNFDLLSGYRPYDGQTFNLLTAMHITASGLHVTWSGLNQAWVPSIVNTSGRQTLQVMFLPEPGTLALLALGGLGLLRRRRR